MLLYFKIKFMSEIQKTTYQEARTDSSNNEFLIKIEEYIKNDGKINSSEAKELLRQYREIKNSILAITKTEL